MGLFGSKSKDSSQEEEETQEEEQEFDLKNSIKGMTEKQLLKLLVLMKWEENNEYFSESYDELIDIAKEE